MSFLKKQFNKENSKKGLTMVETLVAISILTIAVIGPLGIIAQALHTSYYTRDQMTAHYLAQEAIEYVRNSRDKQSIDITKNFLDTPLAEASTTAWLGGGFMYIGGDLILKPKLSAPLGANPLYKYSLVRKGDFYSFETYSDSEYMKVYNGIYGDNTAGAIDSPFKREIYFQRTNLDGKYQDFVMTVNVYWKNGSTLSKLTLKEYFTNWASKTGL